LGADFGGRICQRRRQFHDKIKRRLNKYCFVGADTKISKSVEVTADDVKVGAEIMVSGDKNSDGSYAQKQSNLNRRFVSNGYSAS